MNKDYQKPCNIAKKTRFLHRDAKVLISKS